MKPARNRHRAACGASAYPGDPGFSEPPCQRLDRAKEFAGRALKYGYSRPKRMNVRLDKTSLFGSAPLFAGLPAADLRRLEHISAVRTCRKGEAVFAERDAGDSLFIVESGQVKLARASAGGDEVVLDVLGPGDMFGEAGVLGDVRRQVSAICVSDVRLWQLGRENLLALLGQRPEIGLRIVTLMHQRLERTRARLEEATYAESRQRVLGCLRDLAAKHGRPTDDGGVQVNLRTVHATLAELAGTSREAVSRTLAELQEARKLTVDAGRIRLTELPALASVAAGGSRWLSPPPRQRPSRGHRGRPPERGRAASARNG